MFSCSKSNKKPLLKLSSNQLKKTSISSNMEESIKKGVNLIYCSTFQLAWNKLKTKIIGENIKLRNQPPMVANLNKSLSTSRDISQSDYFAEAGYGKDGIIKKINSIIKNRFSGKFPLLTPLKNKTDIISYACLYKNLEFKNDFEKLTNKIIFISGKKSFKISGFGINKFVEETHKKLSKQIRVNDYKNKDDFIISLLSKTKSDTIILAKVSPQENMLQTIETVIHRIKTTKIKTSELKDDETLHIPKIDFDLTHSYPQLYEKRFLNKGFKKYSITKAVQNIRFKLNEKGAILKSDAKIMMKLTGAPSMEGPRKFVFNKPFLLMMKLKKGKYPYFALWIDNPELLVK